MLDRVGASRLSSRLKQAGGNLVLPKDEAPGLAMGLGGVGVTLQDLVQLYCGLARLGTTTPLREIVGEDGRESLRLMDQVAAWQVGNVLMGTPPPENAPHNRIAFKTGTSYGYRDAWSVGFDGRMTIGVWVGRPDGAPVPGLVGRTAAAPILFDAFARTGKLPVPLPKPPKGRWWRATPSCRCRCAGSARWGNWSGPAASRRRTSSFPLNGSRIDVAGSGTTSFRDAGQGRRRGAADDHAGERCRGRRNRWPPPAPGRSARPGLCPTDRDRRDGRCGHSCRQSSIKGR